VRRPLRNSGERSGWSVLLKTAVGSRKFFVSGAALVILSSLAGIALPALAGNVVVASTSTKTLIPLVAAVAGLLLADVIVGAVGRYLVAHASESTVFRLRQRMLHRVLRIEVQALHKIRVGDLISRISADTTLLRDALSQGLVEMFASALFIIGASVLMARLDPTLLLLVGATILITVGGSTLLLSRRVYCYAILDGRLKCRRRTRRLGNPYNQDRSS